MEEERGTLNVFLQSAAQPRRCALRERREALEPASRLKVRAGGAWTPGREGMLEAPLQWLSFEQSSSLQPQGTSLPMSLDLGEGARPPLPCVCLCSVLRRPQTPGRAWTPSTPWTLSPSGKVTGGGALPLGIRGWAHLP